jgi:WD40 repeat protein
MDDTTGLWRKKADHYFNISLGLQAQYMKNFSIESIAATRRPVKIAVHSTLPLSLYLNKERKCSLFSLASQSSQAAFEDLGTADLPPPPGAPRGPEQPNSLLHFNSFLFVATNYGVAQYDLNCADVARGQNIDDFEQLALLRQEQPVRELGVPAATFISSDLQVTKWENPEHSVIEKSKLKPADIAFVSEHVKTYYRSRIEPFKAKFCFLYDHKNVDTSATIPLSGPASSGVRQLAWVGRAPNAFQSICGTRWFDWDILRMAQKDSGIGDGFQLLSIDSAPLLKDTVVIGTHGGNILVKDTRSGAKYEQKGSGSTRPVANVKFSSIIQPLVASTGDDFSIKLWDLRQGFTEPFLVLRGHTHEISALQFSLHRGDTLFSSSYDHTIRIWNINNQYPPHHSLATVTPSSSPVVDLVAGCHRIDSFYYSCINGATGMYQLTEALFEPVIPYRLQGEDREYEKLLYFRKSQQLLAKVVPRVNAIIQEKSDIAPSFPLITMALSKPSELSHPQVQLQNAPIEEVISNYSYFMSKAIPQQLIQSPEPQQIPEALRALLMAQVQSGIQHRDAEILIEKKREVMNILECFSRDVILSIVQVIASSSFNEALEIGQSYLDRLHSNKKLDKFLDVGYFLLYPTIYDDPSRAFRPLSQIDPNARTRLRSVLSQAPKLFAELADYRPVIATAMNDQDSASTKMFERLKKHDSFISMFLCRVFLSLSLSLGHWHNCIVTASQVAKDVEGFPFKKVLFDWLETVVLDRFYNGVSAVLLADHVDPASYIAALTEVIIVAWHAQQLPDEFERRLDELRGFVENVLIKYIGERQSLSKLNLPPQKLAFAIRESIERQQGKVLPQQGVQGRNINRIMSTINAGISTG